MNNKVILGLLAGAAIVGLLIGIGIGRSGQSELAERAERQDEVMAAVDSIGGRLDAMESRFDEITGQIGALGEGMSGQSDQFAALTGKVDQVTTSISDAVSGLSSDISGALSHEIGGLSDRLANFRSVVAPETPIPAGERLMPGETLALGDGQVRIFLSSVSADGQSARVAVNGTSLQKLTVGTPVQAGDCEVTLTGLDAPAAIIDSECGGAAAAEPVGLGAGTEVPIATTASLADGALRVFLSRIDPENRTVRVAINGTEMTTLKLNEPVSAGKCTLSLTGMDRSVASLDASC